jgi:hypothetical protein
MIACIVIACIAIYYFSSKKETFENIDHSRDDELATFAYEYLISPSGIISGYDKYFKFLREAMNVNPILSDKGTYEKLRDLRKNDKLSKEFIVDYISEKPAPKPTSSLPF